MSADRELLSHVRAAVDKYGMIPEGSSIAVGVSGGKDSLCALYALARLREFYPNKFTVKAISADMNFHGQPTDFSAVTEFCEGLGVEHIIRPTELYKIIFEDRKEKNPCSLCARMRRGILHVKAKETGCDPDKIRVIATGGMATMVESGVDCIDVIDRRLTLDGLQMLYQKNKGLNKKRVLQD